MGEATLMRYDFNVASNEHRMGKDNLELGTPGSLRRRRQARRKRQNEKHVLKIGATDINMLISMH